MKRTIFAKRDPESNCLVLERNMVIRVNRFVGKRKSMGLEVVLPGGMVTVLRPGDQVDLTNRFHLEDVHYSMEDIRCV
jgi:hypothetical protein